MAPAACSRQSRVWRQSSRNSSQPPLGGELKGSRCIKHAGGGNDMHVRVPKKKITKSLHGDHKARLTNRILSAMTKPSGERAMRGEIKFTQ